MVKTLYDQWWHLKVFYVDSSDSGHSGSTRFRMYIIGWWKDDVIEVFNMNILYDMIVAETKNKSGLGLAITWCHRKLGCVWRPSSLLSLGNCDTRMLSSLAEQSAHSNSVDF